MNKKIIIIGAGAAGIGMGVTLTELGIRDFLILEKTEIANSFKKWPQETRFITPSFSSNGFGMSDLNAVSVDTSPAYTLGKERLSGKDYAEYLELLAKEFQLPIFTNSIVNKIRKSAQKYVLETELGEIIADYIIFAMGEYSFPDKNALISGREHGIHYSEVTSWQQIHGEEQIIIGGNESGIDAALNLAEMGKRVSLYTNKTGLLARETDPSIRLSPLTRQRFFAFKDAHSKQGDIKIYQNIQIASIHKKMDDYELLTADRRVIASKNRPILCTGFSNGAELLAPDLFTVNAGEVSLNRFDESLRAPNIFLVGPSVRNQGVIFCYIYKFRQRFAIIAEEIAQREQLSIDQQRLSYYKQQSFYLDDCENCVVNCQC